MVVNTSVPLTVTAIFSPTLDVDGLALYGLSASPAPAALPVASYPWSHEVTITYSYDALFRLTEASYSNGRSFSYENDAVGNRLSETVCLPPAAGCLETEYTYDEANRMTAAGVIPYDWDNNGNLTDDGGHYYTYDSANRLTAASTQIEGASYSYNGLGDRVRQQVGSQVTTYTLDLASGLTQVLAGGTYTYLYGQGRIAQSSSLATPQYFLGDALGSVRQLVGTTGSVTLAKSYEPYGETLTSAGSGSTIYSYTGEIQDAYTNFVYLRARYYAPQDGRFLTRDTWQGDQMQPMSYNAWLYAMANPIRYTDPTGYMFYDRNKAVAFARYYGHDEVTLPLLDEYYDWPGGTLCTIFSSLVLWEGGIRDKRDDPRPENGSRPWDDYPIPYWSKETQKLNEGSLDWGYDQANSPWINTWFQFDFLTKIQGYHADVYNNPPHFYPESGAANSEQWIQFLRRAQLGDIVFYWNDNVNEGKGNWGHAAVIVGWGPQTLYGSKDATLVPPPADDRCHPYDFLQQKPRVVERSGGILYQHSRSIDNTESSVPRIAIVHIK